MLFALPKDADPGKQMCAAIGTTWSLVTAPRDIVNSGNTSLDARVYLDTNTPVGSFSLMKTLRAVMVGVNRAPSSAVTGQRRIFGGSGVDTFRRPMHASGCSE